VTGQVQDGRAAAQGGHHSLDVALVAFIWSTAFGMLQELVQPVDVGEQTLILLTGRKARPDLTFQLVGDIGQ
jgi:hypothetical protein